MLFLNLLLDIDFGFYQSVRCFTAAERVIDGRPLQLASWL
jgi:hypothetical protein